MIIHGSEGLSMVEVKKLEQKEVSEELFQPPKGYARVLVP
jgi:hypothetical protein